MELLFPGKFAVAVEDNEDGTYNVAVADGPDFDAMDQSVSYGCFTDVYRAKSIARQVANYIRLCPEFPLERVECHLLDLLAHLARNQEQFRYRWLVDGDGKPVTWAAMIDLADEAKARAGVPNG